MASLEHELRAQARARGLYRPDFERDACGVGFIAHVRGVASHGIVERALTILENLEHRGAEGSDPRTGDGAGVLIQIPHELFRDEAERLDIPLPGRPGGYGVGMIFLPADPELRETCIALVEEIVREERQELLGWRRVPVRPDVCGPSACETLPDIRQFFVGPGTLPSDDAALERKLYVIRKRIVAEAKRRGFIESDYPYIASLSTRTLVYKGLLTPEQLPRFYVDLADRRTKTALALVHQRFSTNTFPSWSRAHPYRRIAHNGEINTLRGNLNWMRAREAVLASSSFGKDLDKLFPIVDPSGSDSAIFDDVLELLVQTGRSLPHAVMMMIPEAWQNHAEMDPDRRAFYEYHACLMEPWDGPACIAFTDGRLIGAVLDRNGLRPARYVVTKDDLVIMASEAGVLEVPPEEVAAKNRLQPGRMFLVDTAEGQIVDDVRIKEEVATRRPWQRWLDDGIVTIGELSERSPLPPMDSASRTRAQVVHGYTTEDLRLLMAPMGKTGQEATGSMGDDTPLAVLSDRPQLLFNYFSQLFAQVTNPPIDPIREALVMSLRTTIGAEANLFEESPLHCRKLELETPILDDGELARIRELDRPGLRTVTLSTLFAPHKGGLEAALVELTHEAEQAVRNGATLLILSDRGHDETRAPMPSLLATSAVHHHLIRAGRRLGCSLIVESGEPREVMHFCLLLGYGAGAIHPYLAYESIEAMAREGKLGDGIEPDEARCRFVHAVEKGILKVMSKMGISTLQSYRGAQIFSAIKQVASGRFGVTIEYLNHAEEIQINHPDPLHRLGRAELRRLPRERPRRRARRRRERLLRERHERRPDHRLSPGGLLPSKREVEERLRDYREIERHLPVVQIREQGARCMSCGVPFCHGGCPLGNVIPDWNDHVYQNRWEAAVAALHTTNNFPEVTGRVCPAPCEEACVLNIEGMPVTIKQIERQIADGGWERGWVVPLPPERKTGKRVAVVGSGPAGLACAQELARVGHDVVVFERDDRIGGLLRYGIPDFKLEKSIVDRRIAQMKAEGVVFRTGVSVGRDISLASLRTENDAVVLANGATKARDLPLPGRELDGIHFAMEFLPQQNRVVAGDVLENQILATGKKVVILGGGDTGSDCLGTCLRQGAESVVQIELLPRPPERRTADMPWPEWPMILRTSTSHEEGGERKFAILTKAFEGTNGKLERIRAVRLEWEGRTMREIEGSELTIEADLCLLALGFVGPEPLDGPTLSPCGHIEADEMDFRTSIEGVFACGDARRGQSLVVWAIWEGREAARAVDASLMGESRIPSSPRHAA